MDIEKFKEMIEMRNMSYGKTRDGRPVITPSKTNPEIDYMHIDNFVELLDEKGLDIDVRTLKIHKKEEPAPAPVEPTQDKPATEVETIDDVAKGKTEEGEETPLDTPPTLPPPVIETWTEKELRAIPLKDELLKIAGVDPEVNTKGTKEELIIKLIGRPKTFD